MSILASQLLPSPASRLVLHRRSEQATEEIIYDNQMGEADDADAATEIGGGSIVIHKK